MNTINALPLNTTATQRLCEAIRRYTKQVDESQEEYIFHHVHSTLDRDQRQKLLDSANVMLNFFRELLIKGLQTGDFNDHNPDLLSSNIVDAVANCAYKRWFWKNIITLEGYIKQQTKLKNFTRKVPLESTTICIDFLLLVGQFHK